MKPTIIVGIRFSKKWDEDKKLLVKLAQTFDTIYETSEDMYVGSTYIDHACARDVLTVIQKSSEYARDLGVGDVGVFVEESLTQINGSLDRILIPENTGTSRKSCEIVKRILKTDGMRQILQDSEQSVFSYASSLCEIVDTCLLDRRK